MRYESYKETEIESLDSCPNHWYINRIKSLGSIRYGLGQPPRELENGLPIIRATNIFSGRISSENLIMVDPNDLPYERKPILREGEIIVVRSGAYTGDSAMIPIEFHGAVSGYDMVFTPDKKKVFPKYLSYCLLSHYVFKDQLVLTSLRAAQPHLNKEELGSTLIAFPASLKEQTVIAHYLDTKTQDIDKKVRLLEKKIGYYQELRKSLINETVTKGLDKNVELKNSGIDWIGQIPEHWEVTRIKDIFSSLAGGTPSTKEKEYWIGEIPWIPSGKVQNNIIVPEVVEDFISEKALKESSTKMAKSNSILIALTGATCSNIGYLTFDTTINQSIVALLPKQKLNTKYYFNFLVSGSEKIRTYMTGGAQGGINQEDVKFLKVLLPPLSEQTAIASYLDHKTQTIDKIVGNIQKQISTIKELRKTLINDVVTGKIKVTA
jgi:type I restriction enzyme S subunit